MADISPFFIVFTALLIMFIPAWLASRKGYSFGWFLLFGFVFWIGAVVVAVILPDKALASREGARTRVGPPPPMPTGSKVLEGSFVELRQNVTLQSGLVLPAGFVSQVQSITVRDEGILALIDTPEGPVWLQRDVTQVAEGHF